MTMSASEIQDSNRSEVPTQSVTNTPWGKLISVCLGCRQWITLPQYTTLNEKYSILATESIGRKFGGDFELKYYSIGVRGWECDGKNILGGSKSKLNQHQPIDMDLFAPIPFIGRPISKDLDNLTREKFRMRVVKDIGDVEPWAFYMLKLASFDNFNPGVNRIVHDEAGNEVPNPYTPMRDDLFSPQPKEFTSSGSVPISDIYMNSSAIWDASQKAIDLIEVANACRMLYGDASLAKISETSMVWGIDTKADGLIGNGAVIRYTEVQSAVTGYLMTEDASRSAVNNTYLDMAYDIGASDPMLLHTESTAPVGP